MEIETYSPISLAQLCIKKIIEKKSEIQENNFLELPEDILETLIKKQIQHMDQQFAEQCSAYQFRNRWGNSGNAFDVSLTQEYSSHNWQLKIDVAEPGIYTPFGRCLKSLTSLAGYYVFDSTKACIIRKENDTNIYLILPLLGGDGYREITLTRFFSFIDRFYNDLHHHQQEQSIDPNDPEKTRSEQLLAQWKKLDDVENPNNPANFKKFITRTDNKKKYAKQKRQENESRYILASLLKKQRTK